MDIVVVVDDDDKHYTENEAASLVSNPRLSSLSPGSFLSTLDRASLFRPCLLAILRVRPQFVLSPLDVPAFPNNPISPLHHSSFHFSFSTL